MIVSEVRETDGWSPITIYEPIPVNDAPIDLPTIVLLMNV